MCAVYLCITMLLMIDVIFIRNECVLTNIFNGDSGQSLDETFFFVAKSRMKVKYVSNNKPVFNLIVGNVNIKIRIITKTQRQLPLCTKHIIKSWTNRKSQFLVLQIQWIMQE